MKTEEKKEIIITIERFRKAGGTESYMFDLIRSFAQRGIKVHVYADKFDTSLDTYPLIIPHTINLKYIPKPLRIFFFYRFSINSVCKGFLLLHLTTQITQIY